MKIQIVSNLNNLKDVTVYDTVDSPDMSRPRGEQNAKL